jgi:DNA adenine methylase
MKPILKWAGSKQKLVHTICEPFVGKCPGRYFEPFVGSGSVYLHLLSNGQIEKESSALSDVCRPLTLTYRNLRADPEKVIEVLYSGAFPTNWEGAKEDYNIIREEFRESIAQVNDDTDQPSIGIATRMIWLNRACFNGLYRENKHGVFNTPIGKPPDGDWNRPLSLPAPETLREFGKAMPHIFNCDWQEILSHAGQNDWVYLDPPYAKSLSSPNAFTNYGKNGFTNETQKLLAESAALAVQRGAKVVASNASVEWLTDHWRELGFTIRPIDERRAISSKGSERTPAKCVMMFNE